MVWCSLRQLRILKTSVVFFCVSLQSWVAVKIGPFQWWHPCLWHALAKLLLPFEEAVRLWLFLCVCCWQPVASWLLWYVSFEAIYSMDGNLQLFTDCFYAAESFFLPIEITAFLYKSLCKQNSNSTVLCTPTAPSFIYIAATRRLEITRTND